MVSHTLSIDIKRQGLQTGEHQNERDKMPSAKARTHRKGRKAFGERQSQKGDQNINEKFGSKSFGAHVLKTIC